MSNTSSNFVKGNFDSSRTYTNFHNVKSNLTKVEIPALFTNREKIQTAKTRSANNRPTSSVLLPGRARIFSTQNQNRLIEVNENEENTKKLKQCIQAFMCQPNYIIEVQNTSNSILTILKNETLSMNSNKLGLSKNSFKDYSERLKNRKLTSKLKQNINLERPHSSGSDLQVAISVCEKLVFIKHRYLKFKQLNYSIYSTDFIRIHCLKLDENSLIIFYLYKDQKMVTRQILLKPHFKLAFHLYDFPKILFEKMRKMPAIKDDELRTCLSVSNNSFVLSINQLETLLETYENSKKVANNHANNLDIHKNQSNSQTDEYDLYDDHKLKQSSLLKNSLAHVDDKAKNLFDDFSGSEIQGIDYSDLD